MGKYGIIMLTKPKGGYYCVTGYFRHLFTAGCYRCYYAYGIDGRLHDSLDSLAWSHPCCWDNSVCTVSPGNDDFGMPAIAEIKALGWLVPAFSCFI